jgi:hypothetical protein
MGGGGAAYTVPALNGNSTQNIAAADLGATLFFGKFLNNRKYSFTATAGTPVPPADTDNDGVIDAIDNCPAVANTDQLDGDGDACDTSTIYSSGTHVNTWLPILPAFEDTSWPATVCTPIPAVGLDANWQDPHLATSFDIHTPSTPTLGHGWQTSYANDWKTDWINAWSDRSSANSGGPGGHNWTKYSTPVSGAGDFVLNMLADNC